MSEESIYEKNIKALMLTDIHLAEQVFSISENERYKVYQGKDYLDINVADIKTQTIMYKNTIEDVSEIYESLNKDYLKPYQYLFGVGNGLLVKMLLSSQHTKRVVVFEPDMELLYIVLNFFDFTEEIKQGKLLFVNIKGFDLVKAMITLSGSEVKVYVKLYDLVITSSFYETLFNKEIKDVNHFMLEAIKHKIINHGNDVIDTLMGVEHHIVNLPTMIENPRVQELFLRKNSEIAIIVSTGPSLTKQLPLLKKIQDKVTIISVDASYPILEKNGIKPDIVTVLERIPETANFFKNGDKDFQKDIIFLLASLSHKDTVDEITKGTKVISMRPHDYTRYFELQAFGYVGSGMSAANLAYELATVMKFKKITFIGQDLAFGDDDTSHAEDHFFTQNEEDASKFNSYVTRYGGEGVVKTTYYWILFKQQIEGNALKNIDEVETFNSTEGGAKIEYTTEIPFKEFIEKYVDVDFIKETINLEIPAKAHKDRYEEFIIERTNNFFRKSKKIQDIVEKTFLIVQKFSEELVHLNESKQLDKIDHTKIDCAIRKIDFIKRIFETKDFHLMFYDALQTTVIHHELNLATIHTKIPKDEFDKKAKKIDWMMSHREWLFEVAGTINAQRDVYARAIKDWPQDWKDKIKNIPESSKNLDKNE